jgi:sugar lactone lactonase YvrE
MKSVGVMEKPLCVVPSGDRCGEGITWHDSQQVIYWTDVNRFLVHRFSPRSRATESWFFEEPVTSVLQTSSDDVMLVVLGSGPILWRPSDDDRQPLDFKLPNWPTTRLNDSRVDRRGSLWTGSMRNNVGPDGSCREAAGTDGILFRVDPDGSVSEWASNVGISNTLAWSPDNTTFYFGDSPKNRICAYDYDGSTGEISNERVFFEGFSRGVPDGSTIDSEGYLWNCRYGGGCVVRIDPLGRIDSVLDIPTQCPTMCTFGGPNRTILYITSAALDMELSDRLAGGVFAVTTAVHGLPENRFTLLAKAQPT